MDIKVYKLDDILQDFPRKNEIKLIKIDVQGFELNVVRGLNNLLKNYDPVVEIENDHGLTRSAGFEPTQVYNYMYDLGYKSYCGPNEVIKSNWPPQCPDITWRKGPKTW